MAFDERYVKSFFYIWRDNYFLTESRCHNSKENLIQTMSNLISRCATDDQTTVFMLPWIHFHPVTVRMFIETVRNGTVPANDVVTNWMAWGFPSQQLEPLAGPM